MIKKKPFHYNHLDETCYLCPNCGELQWIYSGDFLSIENEAYTNKVTKEFECENCGCIHEVTAEIAFDVIGTKIISDGISEDEIGF